MKYLLTLVVCLTTVLSNGQITLTCGNNTIGVSGEKLSSVKFIGSDKKTNSVTNYYYSLQKDSLKVWEEVITDDLTESVGIYSIARKDISTKFAPYLDELPGTEYEMPLKRIYITCAGGDCVQSASYYSWKPKGEVVISTNRFYQVDGSNKQNHQAFLTKLLAWINN